MRPQHHQLYAQTITHLRPLQKEFQQGLAGSSLHSYDLGRMTDLSLALLHDSGWYDVKYGSSGFSDHGFGAGCAWGRANAARVRAEPQSARLLCDASLENTCDDDLCINSITFGSLEPDRYFECLDEKPGRCTRCLDNHSGTGLCTTTGLDNDMLFAKPVRAAAADMHAHQRSHSSAGAHTVRSRHKPCLLDRLMRVRHPACTPLVLARTQIDRPSVCC